MLISLSVSNFAIIEDLKIVFDENMTVLTGETGAGKSLIIDTISLLLGQRADADMIRYGEDKACIIGVFSYKNKRINELLNKFGIDILNEITIERVIYSNSKNIIKINNSSVSLTILKQIAVCLADVHTQNDTYRLFNPETYMEFITPSYDVEYDDLITKYTLSLSKYLDSYNKYNHILKGQKESLERLEYLEYEQKEIGSLNLYQGIDVELENQVSRLLNFDKIYSSLSKSYELLENEYSSIDNIYESALELGKIKDLDPLYLESYEKMMDSYYILDEIKNDISKEIKNLDFDEDELNYKQETLHNIEKIKNKYHKNVDELIDYLNKITLEIDMVNNYDQVLEDAKKEVVERYNKLVNTSNKLSQYRMKLAKKIEKGIIEECNDLDLNETKFEIRFTSKLNNNPYDKEQFLTNGVDEVLFMISFNKGEPLKALHKVASGGEMSRMMLAFKSHFLNDSDLSLMVFDEIDTGVSGQTAKKIALKLHSLASKTQVLCITHLPQVAAIGDNHIHIYKNVINNRTTTHIKKLSIDERIEEVALMLSGDRMSLYALEHAKALLEK